MGLTAEWQASNRGDEKQLRGSTSTCSRCQIAQARFDNCSSFSTLIIETPHHVDRTSIDTVEERLSAACVVRDGETGEVGLELKAIVQAPLLLLQQVHT